MRPRKMKITFTPIRALKIILLSGFLLAYGCGTAGKNFDESLYKNIVTGTTTQKEIHTMFGSPSKKESKSIILLEVDNNKTKAKEIQISNIQLVSVMSGFMKILRVYTPAKNRKKVEMAAKSILGDLK